MKKKSQSHFYKWQQLFCVRFLGVSYIEQPSILLNPLNYLYCRYLFFSFLRYSRNTGKEMLIR